MTVIMNGKGCTMSSIGFWLVLVGAINWGLVGLGHFFGGEWNVVHLIFGAWAWLEYAIYVIIGICGVMIAFGCKCDKCKALGGASGM